MIETRRRDTGDICVIGEVEKCCRTCRYYGFGPDGCADCNLLVEYKDGKPLMTLDWDPVQQCERKIESVPMVGASAICDGWKRK